MSGTKASTFFWSDWRSDTNLQLCSYAAKGLWMDMLGIMADNGGYLRINDRNLDPADIVKLFGGTVADVEILIAELERNGVFSRDRRWSIFCRRQVRGEKNRRNGRLGGEAKSRSDKEKQISLTQEALPLSPIPNSTTSTSDKGVGLNVVDDWPEDYFERFWMRYPPGRKTEKKAVEAKLVRIRRDREVTFAKLMAGLDRFVGTRPDPKFTPAPLVWLNRGRWDDEYALGGGNGGEPLSMIDIAAGRRGEIG